MGFVSLRFRTENNVAVLCFLVSFFLWLLKLTLYFCSEYMSFVLEALELEDTIKNYERRDATGWSVLSTYTTFACLLSYTLFLS